MAEWQVAPPQYEIANYDEPMIKYRKYVEDLIAATPNKSLKKKSFITISTNVLCADLESSKDPDANPLDIDHYLPVEIALTKWSTADANRPTGERDLNSTVWIINPGKPPTNCINISNDHKEKHKIDYDKLVPGKNHYSEDLESVIKELNSKLLPDRTVFSISLKHCRQDLGVLKWLVCKTGAKIKPINVYSLEDLYVVYLRRLQPELNFGQGMARLRLDVSGSSNTYDLSKQCDYHKNLMLLDETDSGCKFCAKAVSICYTEILLDDIRRYTLLSAASAGDAAAPAS